MTEKTYVVTFTVSFWFGSSARDATIALREYAKDASSAVALATCALHDLVKSPVVKSCGVTEVTP